MNRPAIDLVCLDMAGTTVSDDGAVMAAFGQALDALDVEEGTDQRDAMSAYVIETMGQSKIAVFRALFGSDELAERANGAFEAAYERCIDAGEVAPLPGAVDAIEELRSSGRRVALMTGFSPRTRDALLDALGWKNIADLSVCPSEAGRGRPYPDMVLHAVIALGIDDVARVAVVGDTAADVTTGLRAGASRVIGVLTGADSRERLEAAGATDVIESVRELPELLR
jgi:phosphonatase-like hydrolase